MNNIIKTLHFVPDVSAEQTVSAEKYNFSPRQAVFSRNVRNNIYYINLKFLKDLADFGYPI